MDPNIKTKDMALWKTWKRTGAPSDLQSLIDQMNPIILREVGRWSSGMSRSLLESEGKRLAVEAFKTYDPNMGTALSTYVASRLPKLSRMVYSNQNAARLSETRAMLFHTYNRAVSELSDEHGREPTHAELADRLVWSPQKLKQFQLEAHRKEFIESEEHPEQDTAEDHLVDYIYHDLTPLQQKIFEFSTGYRGAPKLQGGAIMKRLAISQGQLSYQKSLIVKLVELAKTNGR